MSMQKAIDELRAGEELNARDRRRREQVVAVRREITQYIELLMHRYAANQCGWNRKREAERTAANIDAALGRFAEQVEADARPR